MANRREFIQAGVAVAATAAPAFSALGAPAPYKAPLYKVIVDQRFSAAVSFGAEAKRLGADVHGMRGNVTDIWYHDLYHRWRKSPAAVGGMTNYNTMFVLNMMANDVGMRIVYRANHRTLPDGSVSHELFGPHNFLARQMALGGAEADWSRKAAGIIMGWPDAPAPVARSQSTIGATNARMIGSETLVSWIIAPVERA